MPLLRRPPEARMQHEYAESDLAPAYAALGQLDKARLIVSRWPRPARCASPDV